ncbi:MAG TPA: hypothetical protein VEM95_02195, partial [Thermoplasmata archaeon]|nr:hypothetical protein [Thermoplasmata archaeon]
DRAALAIDSVGRLHLTWTENATGGARQVFYARFEGGAWTLAEQLSHSIGYAGFPSLAVDAQDRPHVVWYGFDGAFYQVYYRRFQSGAWTAERALTNENVDATNPAIALGPAGDVNVVWFRQNRNATLNEIAYLRLVGDTLVENRTISPPNVDAIDPSLVVDGAGDVHVVWSALVGGVDRIQHAVRPTDAPWAVEGIVSPPGIGARHASLALHHLGTPDNLRVVWEGTDGQIYVQAGPAGWSAPSPLSFGGVNLYPSARWAQNDNPLCPDAIGIDVIWTHQVGNVYTLGYASLSSAAPCVPGPEGPLIILDVGLYVGIGIGAIAVVSIIVFVLWRRQRAPRPPGVA